jgi:DNA-binding IclR family transcriptional regulator
VTPGLASVAAVVLEHNGHPVAAVAVTYEASEEHGDTLATAVRRTADELTRRLGGA